MNDIYSFYQLISKYQIEIPIIQRDYAQGRSDTKAADVRKSLVAKMIYAVKNCEPLFFDFVYGRVDGNKFIPFDGQQRLTTLFLFHKYVFEKCQSESNCTHKCSCICKDILNRFSYATRQSSREFCEQLIGANIIPGDKYGAQLKFKFIDTLKKDDKEKEEKANKYIKSIDNWIYRFVTNQSWFYPDWEKDPTVMGMLAMLDEIHTQINKETDFKTFAEKLTSGCNCPITFHFVDMGEHKMSDVTYVKMNARGKQLTPFENFKASLEQYLEKKEEYKQLAIKLKTNIDDSWLDLFWNVENESKTEKELPDSLMMSFFNRHFMNVWRCWYANSTKTDDLDKFNKRIQKEMPLYPSKDDFVSFEIYSYVMDNCGVDNCLTPIFNICDALCEKDNSLVNDCQAVWNRDKEKLSWNLYQGDKSNNNRETYPSRVAFYTLMKYFATDTDKTTLAQWMRVVWNIIENSTIDSSETYHAALSLINKISTQSHSIYNALANKFDSFNLGSQYHAKDQVKEEIAKAKQIIDNGSEWETKIIDAEKYAFFKGAIRFLFQDENGKVNWCNFGIKWGNAQKYFDENGVKDGKELNKLYKTNSLLMKSLLANCDDFEHKIKNYFEFSNDDIRWKRILIAAHWRRAVDVIMSKEVTTETKNDYENNTKDVFIRNIIDDELMSYVCNKMSGAWLRNTYHGYQAIWISGYPAKQIVLNPILARLKCDNIIDYRDINTIENCRYYKCLNKNVDFKYEFKGKDYFFNWKGNTSQTTLDVYLTEDNWNDYKKRTNSTTEEDTYYCFKVTPEMESNPKKFTDALEQLIDDSTKSIT
ncbi:MAG: DUF262 domain-containing protein [Bacteroidales bacterium]|nr:DUF262 domain-containing protein [Bacteroidales bacterium]MBO7597656.1 DUF262 domain-containing protein [Bacteroidales bacterium]